MKRARRSSFCLHALAHGRFARVLVHALAMVLLASNAFVGMLPAAKAPAPAPAMAAATAQHHCHQEPSAAAFTQTSPHESPCPCCGGGACACLHAFIVLPQLAWASGASPWRRQPFAVSEVVFVDAVGARLLRPPIV